MDPRAVLHPVGRQPASVYWIRRVLLLVGLVLVVVLLAHACSGGGGGSPAAQSSPRPTNTSAPSPAPTSSPARHHRPLPVCRRGQLEVTASTDAVTYRAGAEPELRAVVRNAGATCRYDPAPAERSWRILSGSDEVWTTDDCQRSKQAKPVRLAAHKSFTYALTWNRHRSVQGCASPGAAAQPGTYRLYVRVMGSLSHPAVFHLAG